MKRPTVKLFTDGSCPKNDGNNPGGWAFILRLESGKEIRKSGFEKEGTTNNRMEIYPLIFALQMLPRPCNVILYSDSQYVTKGISEWLDGWKKKNWITSEKKPVKNIDLWKSEPKITQ